MSKRKYPEVKGYWVYSIKIKSNGKYYIGVSQMQCRQRWHKSAYKGGSLKEYLQEWESMEKTVLVDNLTKEQAYQYEDNIIRALQMNDLCINKQRSGLIEANDVNAYMREYRKNNTEYRERHNQQCYKWRENNKEKYNEYRRQWRLKNKDKINQRSKQWRENNREKYNEWQRQYRLKKKLEREQQHTVVH